MPTELDDMNRLRVQAERRARDLKDALQKYGRHLCGCKREDMLPCSCGFIKATQASGKGES